MVSPADILEDAADIIDVYGHIKSEQGDPERGFCAVGALRFAVWRLNGIEVAECDFIRSLFGNDSLGADGHKATEVLHEYLKSMGYCIDVWENTQLSELDKLIFSVAAWSDSREQGGDVADGLRLAAKDIRNEAS